MNKKGLKGKGEDDGERRLVNEGTEAGEGRKKGKGIDWGGGGGFQLCKAINTSYGQAGESVSSECCK